MSSLPSGLPVVLLTRATGHAALMAARFTLWDQALSKTTSQQSKDYLMPKRIAAIALTILAAAGCSPRTADNAADAGNPYPIPPEVVAIAGPNQDLTTATLVAEDDCYWYSHAGPVETTLVPLRAANGNQICNARPS